MSVTTVIQYIYKQNTNTGGLSRFRYERFINFSRIETQFLLCWPHKRAVHPVMFKISVSRDLKIPTTSFNGQNPTLNGRIFNSRLNGPVLTDSFSKSLNSQDHLFRAKRHPHSSPIFCLGFIMSMVIVISFAHERKTAPNDYAHELLTWIVQSPTNLNDKTWLTKNDYYKINHSLII